MGYEHHKYKLSKAGLRNIYQRLTTTPQHDVNMNAHKLIRHIEHMECEKTVLAEEIRAKNEAIVYHSYNTLEWQKRCAFLLEHPFLNLIDWLREKCFLTFRFRKS